MRISKQRLKGWRREYDARADAAKQQRDQELTERQQFEAGYQHKRDEVIFLP
jgi:hypothetical protein